MRMNPQLQIGIITVSMNVMDAEKNGNNPKWITLRKNSVSSSSIGL